MAIIEPSAAVNDGTGTRIISQTLGSPAAPAVAAVLAAVTDTAVEVTVTTGITSPAVTRALTATAGGTAADIKAISVTVNGTDAGGAAISEVLPVFTVNTAGSVTGSKAFKTVTSVVIPPHDGTGATTSIGTSDKLGLGAHLARNTVIAAYRAGAKEGTAPTVAVSASALSSNTVDLNSASNGTEVIVDYYQS